MKNKLFLLSIVLIGTMLSSCSTTQTAAKKAEEKSQKALRIKEKLVSKAFTYNATFATPMASNTIHLTSSYYLKVSKDTVTAYLPYYGRAYTAPVNSSDNGIKFTSTKFSYEMLDGKRKGNWKINIKTLDTNGDISLHLDVWENGTAQVYIEDQKRQAISFDGEIEDKK